ncbi:MAG: ABC transporter substrate-binding protein [Rhodobacteraceae bacterium]|nr:ABC transporter substrate-binding protein [Paracoccaceae bacterium]
MIRASLFCAALAAAPALADPHPDASRIVSIGGAVTEIVVALGEQDRLVARDTTSNHPASIRELPDVGYVRRLSPEGILSVDPDLLIAEEGAGPPEAVALLNEAAVPMETIPSGYSRDAVGAKIRAVAEVLGVPDRGEALASEVLADIDAATAGVAQWDQPPRILFVLSLQGGRVMAAGSNTSAQGIIDMVGAQNALTGIEGYKLVTDEAVALSNADVILMMDRGAGPGAQADELFSHPAIMTTPAAQSRRLVRIDGMKLLGFSVRTGEAVRELAAKLALAEG